MYAFVAIARTAGQQGRCMLEAMRTWIALVCLVLVSCTMAVAPSPSPTETGRTTPPSAAPTTAESSTPAPSSAPLPGEANVPAGAEPRAVSFVDESTGFAVAGTFSTRGGTILATQDGGKTWAVRASLDIFPAGGLTQLRFVDPNNGWLLTSVLLPGMTSGCAPPSTAPNQCRTVIFKTSDGGRTWREQLSLEQPSKLGPGLRALTAIDAQHAWAIGLVTHSVPEGLVFCDAFYCNREVLATTDGEHWSVIATLPAFSDQLDFVDRRTGWATTYTSDNGHSTITSTVHATSDGGRSWSPQLSAPQPALGHFQIDFIDAQNGWALLAGSQGGDCGGAPCTSYALYRTNDGGRSWQKLQDGKPPTAWWSPRNNVSILGSPRFVNAQLGWIPLTFDGGTNPDGILLTSDGGRTWSRVFPASPPGDDWDIQDATVAGGSIWVVGERIADEAWFIARSDASGAWTYQVLIPQR